jgi:hypothetical protein
MTIENFYKIQEELASHFSSMHLKEIKREDIFWALFLKLQDSEDIEWAGDLWDLDLNYNRCLELLADFDFDSLHTQILSEEDLIPDSLLIQYKVRVKFKGQIWIIHRYDADPFPSNPHAHCLEQNIKLDLSNGNCYRKRDHLYTIKARDLICIRQEIEKVYKGELPPLVLQM